MRNPIVILVALYIGLETGSSVPWGEIAFTKSHDESSVKNKNKLILLNLTPTESVRANELPNDRTDIDENALYENAAAKQKNQSERAFIYINQKYKNPRLHQYFKLAQNGLELSRSFHLPPSIPQASLQRLNEPCKSDSAYINAYFQGYDFLDRSLDIASYFVKPPRYNCNFNKLYNHHKSNNYNDNERSNDLDTVMNQQREYIELLKSPLLRPFKKGNLRSKYGDIPDINVSSPKELKDYHQLYRLRNQHNPTTNILVDERKNGLRLNYGFNAPYNKGALQRVEDRNFEGDFINDDDAAPNDEKTQDEDKLLDQYLKDTLEDQVINKEKAIVQTECSNRECILKSTKTSSSTGPPKDFSDSDCKCEVKPKQNNAHVTRNKYKPNKAKSKFNETKSVTKPSKILSEDSNIKPNSHDLKINSKPNSSLFH